MFGNDRVKEYFKGINKEDKIIYHKSKTDTVEHAAVELSCDEDQICKTMAFIVGDEPIVISISGKSKIDNAKYKATFHKKAKMIPFEDVEKIIGHIPGGVCPFAVNDNVKVYLDNSLKKYNIVYAAGGSPDTTIGITIDELEKYSKFTSWVDVCK